MSCNIWMLGVVVGRRLEEGWRKLDLAVDLHFEGSSGEINKTVSFSSHADK